MALSTLLRLTNNIIAPIKKIVETLARILFIDLPVTLNKGLEFGKEFFDWIQVGRMG
jgi:hypothetical protein